MSSIWMTWFVVKVPAVVMKDLDYTSSMETPNLLSRTQLISLSMQHWLSNAMHETLPVSFFDGFGMHCFQDGICDDFHNFHNPFSVAASHRLLVLTVKMDGRCLFLLECCFSMPVTSLFLTVCVFIDISILSFVALFFGHSHHLYCHGCIKLLGPCVSVLPSMLVPIVLSLLSAQTLLFLGLYSVLSPAGFCSLGHSKKISILSWSQSHPSMTLSFLALVLRLHGMIMWAVSLLDFFLPMKTGATCHLWHKSWQHFPDTFTST